MQKIYKTIRDLFFSILEDATQVSHISVSMSNNKNDSFKASLAPHTILAFPKKIVLSALCFQFKGKLVVILHLIDNGKPFKFAPVREQLDLAADNEN